MGDAAPTGWIDYATYLATERDTDRKHEWLEGRVYAMAGGTVEHGLLRAAILVEIAALAAPCGCRVMGSDVKVRVLATGLATYPDASLVCGAIERDPDDRHAVTNPALLVEVLSDSTAEYDRDEKFSHYRRIPSLRDYVLVSQHERRVEVYSREPDDTWTLRGALGDGLVPLTAMPGALDVARLYDGVELAPRSLRAVRQTQ